MEMNIDVAELQMFDGIASCANHTTGFKIGKFKQLFSPENSISGE
jgi:hypothetical protein